MTSKDSSDALLSLFLNPDNISNCTLSTGDGRVIYTVLTEHVPKTVTQVRNTENEVIASLEWRENLPDRVTLGTNKPISMGDWMRKSLIPFNHDISFVDDSKRAYTWKGYTLGMSLELHAADTKNPIAFFHKRRRVPQKGSDESPAWTTPKLVMDARAREIQDMVVLSFLFLEKTKRTWERTSQNAADSKTFLLSPSFGAGL